MIRSFIGSLSLSLLLLHAHHSTAQTYANAGEYMSTITAEVSSITPKLWSYMRTAAHSKSARKIDARRKELIQSMQASMIKIKRMPAYEGDAGLRDSVVVYFRISSLVLNDDYGKLLNMEEIAEQSYDAMEAYLLANDKANEKLLNANDNMTAESNLFAVRHNIRVLEGEQDKISKQILKASEVYDYERPVFLMFFKSCNQDLHFMNAVQAKDVNAIKQNQATLAKYSAESLVALQEIAAYSGDVSLVEACQAALTFYQREANEYGLICVEYLLEMDNFARLKKGMDAKPVSSRTKEDVEKFNAAVVKFNALTEAYNAANIKFNKERTEIVNNWNTSRNKFFDKHIPN